MPALIICIVLPGCITEQARPSRSTAARQQPVPRPTGPVATPATQARSINAAAKVALQPLGLIPYDGNTLPAVSPDGSRIATQVGDGTPGQPLCIEIYDAMRSPMTSVRARSDEQVTLAHSADDEGFFVYRSVLQEPRFHAKVMMDGTLIDADHPPLDPRAADRIRQSGSPWLHAAALASISRSASGAALFFDLRTSRMVVWPPDERSPMLLSPGSIAGCWAGEDALLVTTGDGLYLQRLSKHQSGWRPDEPIRLLRESYVPRATTNPDRPFILIGPGPKDRPEMLQILAMKLIEE